MSSRPAKRKLIKFGLYSLCVTLPKRMVAELGWQPGATVTMALDREKNQLIVRKIETEPHIRQEAPRQEKFEALRPQPAISSTESHDEILPIPEL